VTTPLDPARGPRIEPAAPARRIERRERDQERESGGFRRQPQQDRRDEHDDGEDEGLHVDVLA
jgi:hypothetical protein